MSRSWLPVPKCGIFGRKKGPARPPGPGRIPLLTTRRAPRPPPRLCITRISITWMIQCWGWRRGHPGRRSRPPRSSVRMTWPTCRAPTPRLRPARHSRPELLFQILAEASVQDCAVHLTNVNGQFDVPAGGQLKVLTPRTAIRAFALCDHPLSGGPRACGTTRRR